ncbi:MAG: hypothetical protein JNK05_34220 [Myxococcales bacterium]|nr:hypothetical protein [Myxococcales bacterium]
MRSPTWLALSLGLASVACERRPSEPPSLPSEPPRLTVPPRAPPVSPSRAEPTEPVDPAARARDACSILPEVAVRVFADIDEQTRVTQERTGLAGMDMCQYRWRKRDAAAISARNRERVEREPNLLAAVARRTGSQGALESAEAELRLSILPPRSGPPALWARGFELAHTGQQVVASLGDQAAFDATRGVLAVRRANRTFEVSCRVGLDEATTLALATRIARDVLSRLP